MKTKFAFLSIAITTLCIHINTIIFAQAVNVQDSLALVDFYNSTDGPHWTKHDNWLTDPVSSWYGITVTDTRVTYIRLSNNNLTGHIPPSIGNLVKTIYLDLSGNKLSGSIPSSIGNLLAVGYLNLGGNRLSGTIPSSMGNLNVSWLTLSNNELSGAIPATFSNLTVEILSLGLNQLSGTIPPLNTRHSPTFECYINVNQFTFAGMEALVAQQIVYPNIELQYWPQANIPVHRNDTVLSVSAGGTLTNNTYKWFMVGKTAATIIPGDSAFYPSEPGKYYAEVTNSVCTRLTLHSDTILYNIPLPVTITDLKVYHQGKQNRIDWTSITEINIDKYEIQRSSNVTDFQTIGSKKAIGSSTQKTTYSFIDAQPLSRNNYYRLKIFNEDATITFSNTVLEKMPNADENTLVYPIPASDILTVETSGISMFSMLDASGRILFTTTINGNGSIDVSKLKSGEYFLLNHSTGNVHKVVVER